MKTHQAKLRPGPLRGLLVLMLASGLLTVDVTHAAEAQPTGACEQNTRYRPGHKPADTHCTNATPATPSHQESPIPLPDRWRIVENIGVNEKWYDPYHQNTLKGDRPLHDDWFLLLSGVSDTVWEPRRIPTPVAGVGNVHAGANDQLGEPNQYLLSETVLFELAYLKGDTTFRPPDYEFRFSPAFNLNRLDVEENGVVNIDPSDGKTRNDQHAGVQALFVDKHLRNVSERFDFDAIRVGIQPFNADFRGFLFQDAPLGIRLFGNRDNNVHQYNLGWFRRLEKDTNSGLNDLTETPRHDDVFVANYYWQDLLFKGFNSQFIDLYNRNREADHPFYDENGFIQRPASLGQERPRDYEVNYLGYNGEGRIGRIGVSLSAYWASGHDSDGVFTGERDRINAGFAAAELSYDDDWLRYRLHGAWASGDEDPYDNDANGYDAVFENPLLAGADTSFWIRQSLPLIAGGKVALSNRNGLLNSLRSSKDHGQSNFVNPGLRLIGVGVDADLTPQLRLSGNASELYFDDTSSVEAARAQGSIERRIGHDLSIASIYRPLMSQNIVIRVSLAALLPGPAYKSLYGDEVAYSFLTNIVLTY